MACGTHVKAGAMTGQLHPAGTTAPRRSDAGVVRFGQRDIYGVVLCAEHYGAPYDLLAAALGAQPARLRAITAWWRQAPISALDIQILYRPEQQQTTIWATLTDTTPATITALLSDPRVTAGQSASQPPVPASMPVPMQSWHKSLSGG